MKTRPPEFEEMISLAQQQSNGQLSEAGAKRLEQLLTENAALRREYLRWRFLHAHLTSTDAVMGAVYDRGQLRAMTDRREIEACLAELPDVSAGSVLRHQKRASLSRQRLAPAVAAFAAAAGLLAATLVFLFFVPSPGRREVWLHSIARVTQTSAVEWTDERQSVRSGQRLGPGTLRLRSGQAGLKFRNGAEVSLDGPATFGLESESNASLFAGRLRAKLPEQSRKFVLQAQGVRVIDLGTEFGVEVGADGMTEVHCLDGMVETQARARLPLFYWSFDETGRHVIDHMTKRRARVGRGAARVDGIVGAGAMSFDNSRDAVVNVGNGGGTRFGAGQFGVSSGLTIEVLTIVQWSGDGKSNNRPLDYDEIFRKEDGPQRMLLCFQNDGGARQRTIPALQRWGPTLSFGLHLAADGYSELEVPLDGRNGRPSLESLRDGRPHHIVATYDSWSGLKALYIDGKLMQQAQFPEGTLILSGGPTDATIGNMASGAEPYSGIIDEVAIYDFALSREEVAEHWENVQQGKNYFGIEPTDITPSSPWNTIVQLREGEAMKFDSRSGRPLGKVPVDYERFRNW